MKLPSLPYDDDIRRIVQTVFKGYNHNLYAGDGEIYDMKNMSGLYYPLLSPRPKRYLLTALTKPNGIFGRDKLCWVDGTSFCYDGEAKGTVEDSRKIFASIGPYIVIFPDKKYYNTSDDTFGSLEASWTGAVTFQDGTLYGEAAEANTIYASDVDWSDYFKAGDAVTISGCVATDNNKTPIIREIEGNYLRFYENIFDKGSEDSVTIARTVPDMDFVIENENRLWGGKGDTIYASKLGDIFNWNVFDGLSTDSYSVPVGGAGDITGLFSYMGYPVIFKPDSIFKVYGNKPSNFEVTPSARLGVDEGSGASLAVAGETLFYLSRAGIVSYSGGIPSPIGEPLGEKRFRNAVGGSDGLRYYVSMDDGLFVFDTQTRLWHKEDDLQAIGFAYAEGILYCLADDGKIWTVGNAVISQEAAVATTLTDYGEDLSGQGKWNGGVYADGKIYFIPSSAEDILIIDTDEGTAVLSDMDANLTGEFKWAGGVYAEGKIYCVPFDATDILIIDTVDGTATRSSLGATLTGGAKWNGGVYADGKIYCVPYDATDILIIDPSEGSATRSNMGADLSGSYKWNGCVYADGKIYCIPENSTDILIIDPVENAATRSDMGATLDGVTKWTGGVYADGKIYGIPSSADDILIIDPSEGAATRSDMGAALDGYYKWSGGALLDGKIYCMPLFSEDILVIDPSSGSASLITGFDGYYKWMGCVLADNKIYGVPFVSDEVLIIGYEEPYDETVEWFAEFGGFTESEPNKKGVTKLRIRAELDEGSEMTVKIKYDNEDWTVIKTVSAMNKGSFSIPVIPVRADHYRLKLEGAGDCRIYSISREFYVGSDR